MCNSCCTQCTTLHQGVVKLIQLPALHYSYRGAELGSYKIGDFTTKIFATPSTRSTIMYWAQVFALVHFARNTVYARSCRTSSLAFRNSRRPHRGVDTKTKKSGVSDMKASALTCCPSGRVAEVFSWIILRKREKKNA